MQKDKTDEFWNVQDIRDLNERLGQRLEKLEGFEYAKLFKEKAEHFVNDYNKKSSVSSQSHHKEPYNLELTFRTQQKPQMQIQPQQQQPSSKKVKLADPNIFIYRFQLNCLYETYQKMIRSSQIQRKVDDIISEYYVIKPIAKIDELEVQLMYLSYKRVMIIAPREFIYVRIFWKQNSPIQNQALRWIVTFSILYETKSDKTRAEVIFTAQKIQENLKDKKINVTVFSQIDMKTAAKPQLTKNKGFSEIKKYIQKLHEYLNNIK